MVHQRSRAPDVAERASGEQQADAARRPDTTPRPESVERFAAEYQRLLNYARTEIRAHEALGDLPPGTVEPEDIVDLALLEAFEHADEAPANDGLYPWLRRFVRRAIRREVTAARRLRRERSLEQPLGVNWPDEEGSGRPRRLIDVLPDPSSPIPDQVVESEEFQQVLASILRRLPMAWREPFLLHVRDGMTYQEIARLEGISVSEVRRRIERAREALRAHLADEYDDSEIPPPTEQIFEVLDRIEPTPEQAEQLRRRLESAAA